jgi:uncharacterized protein (TIGR02246 family)
MDTDERQIARIIATVFEDAWNIYDAPALARPYAEDADFTNVVGLRLHGRAAIERLHERLFATVFRESVSTVTATRVRLLRPDIAAVDVDWELSGHTDDAGNPRPTVQVIGILTLTKSNGAWEIAVMHNMLLPPDAAERRMRRADLVSSG